MQRWSVEKDNLSPVLVFHTSKRLSILYLCVCVIASQENSCPFARVWRCVAAQCIEIWFHCVVLKEGTIHCNLRQGSVSWICECPTSGLHLGVTALLERSFYSIVCHYPPLAMHLGTSFACLRILLSVNAAMQWVGGKSTKHTHKTQWDACAVRRSRRTNAPNVQFIAKLTSEGCNFGV